MSTSPSCPVCRSQITLPFLDLASMPVFIGVQWPSREAARDCPKGDIRLVFCRQCGFVWNSRFEPARMSYTERYDNALEFSPAFQDFARKVATRLIETYGIRGREVIDIGCGKGHFLTLLCELGDNRGTGFDPSYEGARAPATCPERMTYFQDVYGEKYTDRRADLISCRHVFEHIPEPVPFLSMVRRTMGERPDAVVYFEVPNVRFILEQLSIWDVIYEHCSYFSRESLGYVFRRCGFDVLRTEEPYAAQFLSIDARLANGSVENVDAAFPNVSALTNRIEAFAGEVRDRQSHWSKRLDEMRQQNCRVAIWGAGAKAVSFLNMMQVGEAIECVVDINPHKQGKHIAGTGQQIVSPEHLREFRPDEIILMNPIYRREVEQQLGSLGVQAQLTEV